MNTKIEYFRPTLQNTKKYVTWKIFTIIVYLKSTIGRVIWRIREYRTRWKGGDGKGENVEGIVPGKSGSRRGHFIFYMFVRWELSYVAPLTDKGGCVSKLGRDIINFTFRK